ncbi:MAG TPA: flagellin [Acidimicrobiales bacterium]|nr:flagellin [Acidimicrobiales bacterium]
MGLDIVTNTMATEASNDISANESSMQGALEQLSSGYQINSPADDASGYVISQHLQAQIGGFQQAQANTQAGINVVQTADGALNEVSSILQTINSLAVQSANTSATDSTAQAADQAEVNQALSSIVDIATSTVYGNNQLLVNGTASSVNYTFQVGNDNSSASQVAFSLTALNLANLGLVAATLDLASNASAVGVLSVTGSGIPVNSTYTVSVANASAATVAGGAIQGFAAASFQVATGGLTFTVSVNGAGASTVTVAAGTATLASFLNDITTALGTYVTVTSGASFVTITDAADGGAAGSLVVGGLTANLTALGLTSGTFGGTSTVSIGGATASVTNAELAGPVNVGSTFQVSLSSSLATGSFVATASYNGGTSLNAINFSVTSANAVATITNAIDAVSSMGGTLGAVQNQLTDISDNESVMVQNLQSSNAQIKDANMANEMVTFTQEQTLVQAGVSMLAQANQIPQYVLKLLS